MVILGRIPDESGIETFEAMLGSGAPAKRRQIILAIARSAEARTRSALAPMIAMEALRIRRWRFLPWNRSVLAIAASQSADYASIEKLSRSIENNLSVLEQNLNIIEEKIRTVSDFSTNGKSTVHSDEKILTLLEHLMRSLKGLSFTMAKVNGALKRYE